MILALGSMPVYATKTVSTVQYKTMYVGKSSTLKINGKRKKAKWTSSKKSVATVSKKGKVKAKKPGKCTIKAVLKNKTFTFKLTVKKSDSGKRVAPNAEKISLRLLAYYYKKGGTCLKGFDAEGKIMSSFYVLNKGFWNLNSEYNSKDDTYTAKAGFDGFVWGWHQSLSPCYFEWECYNSKNQLVKSGVYASQPFNWKKRFRDTLIITGLKKDSYTIKVFSYYQRN